MQGRELILGIETSCDETAAAIVADGTKEISSVVASSRNFFEETGGVVPEIAARKQLEFIIPVVSEVMRRASAAPKELSALAVTVGPGLIGSLVVGVETAKALSFAWSKPLIPVNHLIGHIYANFVDSAKTISFPAVVLIVSGGHTDLVLMKDHGDFEYLGGTLDDAAGEAFDKTARLLGLSRYLGGSTLSKKASECVLNPIRGKLPRPMLNRNNYDFSFSGLKTAVKRLIEETDYPVDVVAREFEDAIVEVLVEKTVRAAKNYNAGSILLAGGVAANKTLRDVLRRKAGSIPSHLPPVRLCTDNAVCTASAAFFNRTQKDLSEISPNPSLGITDKI